MQQAKINKESANLSLFYFVFDKFFIHTRHFY